MMNVWNFTLILLLVALLVSLAVLSHVLHQLQVAWRKLMVLQDERNRLQEDRHQLFSALNARNNQRIGELEYMNKAMQEFIRQHAKPPEPGDDADWWKRGDGGGR